MTYKLTFILNRIAVKCGNNQFLDRLDMYLDVTETVTIDVIKEGIRKLTEIKMPEAEKYKDFLFLLETIEDELLVEFEDKMDYEFNINDGDMGTAVSFPYITLVLLQLTIIEINEAIKNE